MHTRLEPVHAYAHLDDFTIASEVCLAQQACGMWHAHDYVVYGHWPLHVHLYTTGLRDAIPDATGATYTTVTTLLATIAICPGAHCCQLVGACTYGESRM